MTTDAESDEREPRQTTESSGPRESVRKTEPPLVDDTEILALAEQFANCRWPCEQWTHRAHLAVALVYLEQWSFEEALTRLRHDIVRYNSACGKPNSYHETVTVFFLRRIAAHREAHPHRSLPVLVEDLVQVCSMQSLDEHYSRELLGSPAARSSWQPPDRRPLNM